MLRYNIYRIGTFWELFDEQELITLFASEDIEDVRKARQDYQLYGEIQEDVVWITQQ